MKKYFVFFCCFCLSIIEADAQRSNLSGRTSSVPRSANISRTINLQRAEIPAQSYVVSAPILMEQMAQSDDMIFESAIENVRENCGGIVDEFNKMKTIAGINTAVTGTGTLAGGGAVATGFIKQSKDVQIAKLEMEKLRRISETQNSSSENASSADVLASVSTYYEQHKNDTPEQIESQIEKLTSQSKNLGNWRTGLMAGSTATNIAGAIIAGKNKASTDLKGAIEDCKNSVKDLSHIYEQNRDAVNASDAEKIISECGKWESADLSKIDNRSTSSMWFSIAGATTGLAGTITSATANTDKTREGDANREKNLNTASNVLAIGTTATSLTATILNAARISSIIKVSEIADDCEGVLK